MSSDKSFEARVRLGIWDLPRESTKNHTKEDAHGFCFRVKEVRMILFSWFT